MENITYEYDENFLMEYALTHEDDFIHINENVNKFMEAVIQLCKYFIKKGYIEKDKSMVEFRYIERRIRPKLQLSYY
jgi:hypothetical protein